MILNKAEITEAGGLDELDEFFEGLATPRYPVLKKAPALVLPAIPYLVVTDIIKTNKALHFRVFAA